MFEWKREYSVGNALLDKEHERFFELAKRAFFTGRNEVSPIYLKNLINDFVNFAKQHFKHEEYYMKQIGYPFLTEHAALHENILRTFVMLSSSDKPILQAKEELIKIVRAWLVEHMLTNDIRIERWQKKQQINITEENVLEKEINELEQKFIDYDYVCDCPDMVHKIPESIHLRIVAGEPFVCERCGAKVRLKN